MIVLEDLYKKQTIQIFYSAVINKDCAITVNGVFSRIAPILIVVFIRWSGILGNKKSFIFTSIFANPAILHFLLIKVLLKAISSGSRNVFRRKKGIEKIAAT